MSQFFNLKEDLSPFKKLPLDIENSLCIDGRDLLPYNINLISKFKKYILDNPNKKVVFHMIHEGVQVYVIKSINEIVTDLIGNHNFKLSDFVILVGCYPHQINVDLYIKYIKDNNFLEIKTLFANTLEFSYKSSVYPDIPKLKFLLDIKYNFEDKSKNFLMYMGKSAPHRIYILDKLNKLGLLKNSYYSCYFEKRVLDTFNLDEYPLYLKDSINSIKQMSHLFPITMHKDDIFDNLVTWSFKESEKFHYTDTFFSIVPETHFMHNNQSHNMTYTMTDQVFITEKTYRIIAGKAPFIIVGFTNTLQVLRDSGYKTFHPYIDESYDLIENDEERLNAIIKEVQRLCDFSKSQWQEWATKITPIVNHNQKVLLSSDPKHIEIY